MKVESRWYRVDTNVDNWVRPDTVCYEETRCVGEFGLSVKL